MAITPRTILTSAAPATVAVVSLYFFTVLGTAAFTCLTNNNDGSTIAPVEVTQSDDKEVLYHSNACDHVAERFGGERAEWSEFAWINYAYCYDQSDNSNMVIQTTRQALEYHPSSEALYNLKGYHLIVSEEHAEAIDILRQGMESVSHNRNGVMANNLAWAGLWEPRKMDHSEARKLYVQSLALSPNVCETLHTGLFVEYAIANQAQGLERFDALERFSELRSRYNRCLDRIDDGDWKTVVEIVGAAVIFDSIDNPADSDAVHPLMRTATSALIEHHGHASIDTVCEEAMPLADLHHECVDTLRSSMKAQLEAHDSHRQRNDRAAEVKSEIIEQYGDSYPVLQADDGSGCAGNDVPQIDIYIE